MTPTAAQLTRLSKLCAQPESELGFDDALTFIARTGTPVDHYCDNCEWLIEANRLLDKRRKHIAEQVPEANEYTIWNLMSFGFAIALAGHNKNWTGRDLGLLGNISQTIGTTFANTFYEMMEQYLSRPPVKPTHAPFDVIN